MKAKVEALEKNSVTVDNSSSALSYKIFRVLFALLWIQNCAYSFFNRVLVRIPIINLFADLLLPALLAVLVIGAVPYIFKKARATEVFIYLGLLVATLLSLVFATDYVEEAIETDLFRVLVSTVPFVFVGTSLDIKENERWLYWLSLANVIAMIFFQVYNLAVGNEMIADNMSPAYYALPSIMYLLISAYNKSGFLKWGAFVLGVGLLLSYGTRGPILCLVLFSAGLIIHKILTVKSIAIRAVLLLVIGASLYAIFFTDFVYEMLIWLSEVFSDVGLSTRIFDMALEDNILDDSGRGRISELILKAISENAIFGKGVMADRGVLSGSYAHNILYEMWYSFGVIIGSVVFGFTIGLPIYAFCLTKDRHERLFLWLLACASIVKLFMSSSFLYEVHLYLLLGLSISIIRREKKQKI